MNNLSFSKFSQYIGIIISILVSFAAVPPVFAQATQALVENWRSPDYNFTSNMMDSDSNGNLYVLGSSAATNVLSIKKFNDAGTLAWQTVYDPAERLSGVWIAADGVGNAIVAATIVSGSSQDPSGWLILKYDTNGNLLWSKSLPGIFSGTVRVEVDTSNNIYVAGFSLNDSVLIKYSPAGTTLWSAAFDNNGAVDQPFSMAISPDSSRIGIAGKSGNLFMALMYDANGNRLWANTNTTLYPANDLAFGPGNVSYFATGTYFPQDPNPYQMAIVAIDTTGNQSWVKSYSVGDRTYRLGVDSQGNVVATGIDSVGYIDWMTIKTDSSGNLLWSRRYDGGKNNDETPNMLTIDASGAVYVTGSGGPNPSSGTISYKKGVVAMYNADGSPQWAVWDDYAGGNSIRLGAGNRMATLGWGYLVATGYTLTGLPDVIPSAPSNLSLVGSSLNFADNAFNEFWVEIQRCTGVGCTNFTKIGQTLGENAKGFTDATTTSGTTYSYRVRAVGFMGYSGFSNVLTVVIPGSTNPPAAPSNLTAAAISKSQILLNWNNNSTAQTGVKIERCQGSSCTNFSQITAVSGTAYTDSGLIAKTSYRYRVRAYNASGDSPYSNIAGATTPKR